MNRKESILINSIKISQEEVNEKTLRRLDEVKANDRIQAIFYNILCKEVIKSDNFMLAAVKIPPKRRYSDPWTISYQIICEYLKHFNMKLTIDTIEAERGKKFDSYLLNSSKLGIRIDYNTITQMLLMRKKPV